VLQRNDVSFEIAPSEFHERKRRRISEMKSVAPPPVKIAPTSAPATHEIAGFLPGRLEFEHELDNEAEDIVKDLEFGVCYEYGGDQIIEDENDPDVLARAKWTQEKLYGPITDTHSGKKTRSGKSLMDGMANGVARYEPEVKVKQEPDTAVAADGKDGEEEPEEVKQPVPIESQDSLKFKLTLLEMYNQRLDRRQENKSVMFDRGLLEYKKVGLVVKY
jgi:transcriptional adapter 2-alpha